MAPAAALIVAVVLAAQPTFHPAGQRGGGAGGPTARRGHGAGAGTVNVRDFGAVGDGAHDDTAAIQAALHAAGERAVVFSCNTHLPPNESAADQRRNGLPGADSGVCGMSRAQVFFPSGNYTITRSLVPGVLNIRNATSEARTNHSNAFDGYSWMLTADILGEGGAAITQLDPTEDIFYTPLIWRWKVSGLTLIGGLNHFHFGTHNLDNAFVTITDCLMSAARGAVIRTLPNTGWNARHRPRLFPAWAGVYHGCYSTQLTVRDCEMFNNEQVLWWTGDTAAFEDVWVEGHGVFDSAKALFENYAKLMLNRMLGVPGVVHGVDQRWIDNYGDVTARGCRFGGEGGGMTIVSQRASFLCVKASPTAPCQAGGPENTLSPAPTGPYPPASTPFGESSIRFYENDIFSNCAYDNAAFDFEQIPTQFILHDSQGLMEAPGDNPGVLIAVNPQIDLGEHGQLAVAAQHPGALTFDVKGNKWVDVLHRTNWSALPAPMLPLQSTPVRLPNPPTVGHWRVGQQVWATQPSAAALGWVCVAAGWPGQWLAIAGATLAHEEP